MRKELSAMLRAKLLPVLLIAALAVAVGQQQKSRRPPTPFKKKSTGLDLPNNATSIRENIVDTFSCEDRIYGYYADIDNDCQIFHVCLPQIRNSIRFSFICPAETVFNQATFVCTRTESSIPCEESEKYYKLNEAFGKVEGNPDEVTDSEIESTTYPSYPPYPTQRPSQRPPQATTQVSGSTPQRPTRPPTYPTPDYQTTQYTQRPPKPTQNKKRRQ